MEQTSFLITFVILSLFSAPLFADPISDAWDFDPIYGLSSTKAILSQNSKLPDQSARRSLSAKDPFWTQLAELDSKPDTSTPLAQMEILVENYEKNQTYDAKKLARLMQENQRQIESLGCELIKNEARLEKLNPQLVALDYGHCGDSKSLPLLSTFPKTPITSVHRIRRAERFYGDVRFPNAAKVLDTIDLKKLDKKQWCQVRFLTGRTLYRIKSRRSESLEAYKSVAQKCTEDPFKNIKKRSLYSWGKRTFTLGKYVISKKVFKALLTEFPKESHADDALLYLARIEQKTGKVLEQKKWVTHALETYPDGDMVHEIVWEFTEPLYRKKDYKAFLSRLHALKLPASDGNYLSQGRLLYFEAQASLKTKKKKQALLSFQKAWEKYPFSFYGYLSHLRLRELQVDSPLPARNADLPTFMDSPKWKKSLQAYAIKYDIEPLIIYFSNQAAKNESALWQRAYMLDRRGIYSQSHNIIRRKIPGRPWMNPLKGRDIRLQLAWPMPFKNTIENAIKAEKKQHPKSKLHAAFPSSIMREESSFIVDVESWAGALGLMQLMPRTALSHDDDIEGSATIEKLKTADVNIRVGVDHLNWLSRKTGNHPAMMAAAYNAGLGAVNKWVKNHPNEDIALWVEDIPYFETRNYTKRVVGSYAAYQWMFGASFLDTTLAKAAKK